MQRNIKSRGFTIVELLIVIVIIGILATIVIVAYNGVTAKANTAAAQSAAQAVTSKAEIYNAEKGQYPAYPSLLTTGSTSTDTYNLTGVTFDDSASDPSAGTGPWTAPAVKSTALFYSCTTGMGVKYFDYGSKTWVPITTGGAPTDLSGCTFKKNSATS